MQKTHFETNQRENTIVWGIFLAALIIRLFLVILADSFNRLEPWEYDIIAKNILSGRGYTFEHLGVIHYSFGPPIYPFLSALIYSFTKYSYLALAITQAFFSAATSVLIFKIGKLIFTPKVGLLAAILTILHPGLNVYVTKLHSFNIDVFFIVLMFFTFIKATISLSKKWFALLGVSIGLCLLSRSTIFLFLAASYIFLWLKSPNKYKLAKYFFLSIIIAFVIVSPWLLRNYYVSKKFIFVQESGEVFWRGNNLNATGTALTCSGKPIIETFNPDKLQGLTGIEQDDLFREEGLKFIKAHPNRFIMLYLKKIYYFWWFSPHSGALYPYLYLKIYGFLYIFIIIFALSGILFSLTSKEFKRKNEVYLMLLLFFTITIIQSLFYVEGRHRLSIEPLILILSANGLCLFYKFINNLINRMPQKQA